MFTLSQFIRRSLGHHLRIHLAVALGVAAATAVLTGALIVGDSVRGSLRNLVLDRLGQIDDQLITDRFFRVALADEIRSGEEFATFYTNIAPAIVLPGGTVESSVGQGTTRAGNVLLVGSDDRFWEMGNVGQKPLKLPGSGEIILNEPLAKELHVQIGDEVLLRLPKSNQVPADSPMGRKNDLIRTLVGLKVVDVIPPAGLGRFSLRSSQQFPRNAYVAVETLQDALSLDGRVNAMFLTTQKHRQKFGNFSSGFRASAATQVVLHPTLADMGLSLQRVRQTFRSEGSEEETVFDYYHLSSDRLLLDDAVVASAKRAFAEYQPQPVLTYLANTITKVGDAAQPPVAIPYSMVTAIDSNAALGPLTDVSGQPLGPLADDEIVLNSWAAADLDVKPGDRVRMVWFAPETTHGTTEERSGEFRLKAIVPITEPAEGFHRKTRAKFAARPTRANDPDLTPTVEGVTDQDTIDNWDPPFPYDQKRVREKDDDYWTLYRTTPKAFVSLATGQRLWGSRFGRVTSLRFPTPADTDEKKLTERLLAQLEKDDVRLGFEFIPVKEKSLDAARGTTPFDALFLSLSFFIIASALMLVALLYRLGVEQRATEIGVLLAIGWPLRRVTRLFAWEGVWVAIAGGAVGLPLGIGYAWLMITGLRTWWVGAIATPFLEMIVTPRSVVLGFVSGAAVSASVLLISLWRARRTPVRQLIAGRLSVSAPSVAGPRRWWTRLVPAALVLLPILAVGLTAGATQLVGEAQAGAFVTSGLLLLMTLLGALWLWFDRSAGSLRAATRTPLRRGLIELAARNAGRNPSRSVLTIGLVAIACFLIVAMSAFRMAPTDAGTGGFAWLAESSQPVFVNLNDAEVRDELVANAAKEWGPTQIYSFRLLPGDDASCANLYQATQPRVLGVSPAFVAHFDETPGKGFRFAGSAATDPAERANPWRLLGNGTGASDAVPVILDKNTALYSLHLYGGIGQEFSIAYDGRPRLTFRVVGLLDGSVLQGSLLIDEAQFVRRFPEIAGYRYFLIQCPPDRARRVADGLEEALGDQGLDATSAPELLADFLAVQNTYLSTFQSLGALGLLLGTFGLATIQLRNVFERRGELALFRAVGFHRLRLAQLVLAEHAFLLTGGIVIGTLAALVAVLPHMLFAAARVPLGGLLGLLAVILVIGLATGLLAVRATLRAPLIGALRGD